MTTPRISLVIATLERPDALNNLLRHLEHQTRPPDEIVIVDQSAAEDARTAAYVEEDPRFRLLRIPERGLPNARNVGVRETTGDIILFLDDDSIPDADLVRFHAEAYADPGVHGVGGRVVGGYDVAGAVVGGFSPADGSVVMNFGSSERCDAEHLPGRNMSFRRAVFDRIGGFDLAYGGEAIREETDFCLRARRAGFRLVFEPRASLDHLYLQTGGCRIPRFEDELYWQVHNSMLFVLRYARLTALPLFVLKRVFHIARAAIETRSPSLLLVGMKGLLRSVTTHLSTRLFT